MRHGPHWWFVAWCCVLLVSESMQKGTASTSHSMGSKSLSWSTRSVSRADSSASRSGSPSRPTGSGSLTTRSHGRTRTLSKGVESLGVISILPTSSLTISAECLLSTAMTDYDRACRTVTFRIYNDSFVGTSMALTFFARRSLMTPVAPSRVTPFGLYAMASQWQPRVEVVSNRSHMSFVFPSAPYLDIVGRETVLINLTTSEVIGSGRSPPLSAFVVQFLPTETASPFVLSDAAQGLAGLLGAVSMLLPYPNAMVDSQLAVLAGTSLCFQGDVRELSERGFRLVFPGSTAADPASYNLVSSLTALGFVVAVHSLMLLTARARAPSKEWRRLMNALHYPSASCSVCLILLPGIFLAGFRMVVNPSSTGGLPLWSLAGAAAAALAVGLVLVTASVGKRYAFILGASRCNAFAVRDFPRIIQAYMPARSWGPPHTANVFQVPFYAYKEFLAHPALCVLSMVYGEIGGAVFSFVCESTASCAVQALVLMLVCVGHVFCIAKWRPFRSLLQCAAAGINTSCLFALMACNLSRCYFSTDGPMLTVSLAMLALHLTSATRSALNLICGFLEWRVMRPRVWADGMASAATPWAAAFAESEKNNKEQHDESSSPTARDMELRQQLLRERQPSPEELRTLQDLEAPGIVTLTQTDDDRRMNILSQTSKSRAVLAEIPAMQKLELPPLPGDAQSNRRPATANRLILRGPPMQHLLAHDGPMPPALVAQCRREYELL